MTCRPRPACTRRPRSAAPPSTCTAAVSRCGSMAPSAASYVRRHPVLSPALMEKWRVGVLPLDGGADKRAWSLRGQVLYPVLSEDGKVLAWVSRDPQFETKEQAFNALSPDERAK